MVGVIGWLWIAEERKCLRAAAYAGACGFLLGNIHTYDVITLTAIWGGYLFVSSVIARKIDLGSWGRAIIAVIPTFVSSGYTYYLLKTDEVFAKRVAVETLSPAFAFYVLGYGFVFVFAFIGARLAYKQARRYFVDTPVENGKPASMAPTLVIVWAVANIAVAYLPVSFNRKMLMGTHIPLSILAGVSISWFMRNLDAKRWSFALAGITSMLFLTN